MRKSHNSNYCRNKWISWNKCIWNIFLHLMEIAPRLCFSPAAWSWPFLPRASPGSPGLRKDSDLISTDSSQWDFWDFFSNYPDSWSSFSPWKPLFRLLSQLSQCHLCEFIDFQITALRSLYACNHLLKYSCNGEESCWGSVFLTTLSTPPGRWEEDIWFSKYLLTLCSSSKLG